ncbi:MAG: metallophosphoesterase family protein [Chloroflexota bacterium]
MNVGVLADTHIPKRARDLPAQAYQLLAGVDAIVHAGDVLEEPLLRQLAAIAPLYAVQGNNDHTLALPATIECTWDGVQVAVIHDAGPAQGRAARLRRRFPQADVVIFGHSHIPINAREAGVLLLNPGSPTDKRRQAHHTMALLTLQAGSASAEIVTLD